jgi:hypothetical protein
MAPTPLLPQAIAGRASTCYMNILAVLAGGGGRDLKDISKFLGLLIRALCAKDREKIPSAVLL